VKYKNNISFIGRGLWKKKDLILSY